jgi:hypothetical protein
MSLNALQAFALHALYFWISILYSRISNYDFQHIGYGILFSARVHELHL